MSLRRPGLAHYRMSNLIAYRSQSFKLGASIEFAADIQP